MVSATTIVPIPIGPPSTTPTNSNDDSMAIRVRGSARPVRSDAAAASNSPEPAPRPDTISAPAPRPTTKTAVTWIASAITRASGGSTRPISDTVASMIGPTNNGERRVPGPGRRPSNQAVAMNDAITSHTARVNDRPVRMRMAPMNTSSGPGPRPLHNITATPTAMSQDPATSSAIRAELRRSREGGRVASTTAIAPARLHARIRARPSSVARSDASGRS